MTSHRCSRHRTVQQASRRPTEEVSILGIHPLHPSSNAAVCLSIKLTLYDASVDRSVGIEAEHRHSIQHDLFKPRILWQADTLDQDCTLTHSWSLRHSRQIPSSSLSISERLEHKSRRQCPMHIYSRAAIFDSRNFQFRCGTSETLQLVSDSCRRLKMQIVSQAVIESSR